MRGNSLTEVTLRLWPSTQRGGNSRLQHQRGEMIELAHAAALEVEMPSDHAIRRPHQLCRRTER